MPMNTLKNLLQEPVRVVLDKVVQSDMFRQLALQYAEKTLRKNIIGDNPGNISSPLRAREDEFLALRNMLFSINKAMDRGLISASARKGLLKVFVGKVMLKDDDVLEAFEKKYHTVPPGFLLISPTKTCNLRCVGCYANSSKDDKDFLDYATFSKILSEKTDLWASYFTVLSGGEPLLWRDGDKTLLDILREHKDQYFLMYTNGTMIDQRMADALAEVGNVTPAISMEGFEDGTDKRRGVGTFRRILSAFECLRKAGVPFGVSLTATRQNAELLLSDEFLDFCLEEQGAIYAWVFQYMPIGRHFTLDLMVTPEQRLEMFKREQYLQRERKLFVADFWNSGAISHGCISAGRWGGYFYIDWKGDVMPCAFFPYSNMNIKDVYHAGGDLNQVLFSPFFKDIRTWQNGYGFATKGATAGNWIMPCPMRDHHRVARDLIEKHGARPGDEPAGQALVDPQYHEGLETYNERFEELTRDLWNHDYLGKA
jgi:MoaA/NifB/PqqE/SkfB family radical SAM enzyme